MKKWIAILLCLLLLPCGMAEEKQLSLLWEGITWDSSLEEVRAAMGGEAVALESQELQVDVRIDALRVDGADILGMQADRAAAIFMNGESCSFVWYFQKLDEAAIQSLLDALTGCYGPANDTSEGINLSSFIQGLFADVQVYGQWSIGEDMEVSFTMEDAETTPYPYMLSISNTPREMEMGQRIMASY